MVDAELMLYQKLSTSIPDVTWTVGFPQEITAVGAGQGCIIQQDNAAAVSTSSGIDRISRIAVQIQTWALTPERRNELDESIDTAISEMKLRRGPVNHMTEPMDDQTPVYRSVLLYSGLHDNKTGQIYF